MSDIEPSSTPGRSRAEAFVSMWDSRGEWFDQTFDDAAGIGSHFISEQACALMMDARTAFCAGAWLGCLVILGAATEAQLREYDAFGERGSFSKLIDIVGNGEELHWLRKTRNAIVHCNGREPAYTVDDMYAKDASFEAAARRAVEVTARQLFCNPGT